MWPSSRAPAFGLMGTMATPASSAPTTATHVSGSETAQTPTRPAPCHLVGHVGGRVAQPRVGQLDLAEAQGEAVVGV